MTNKDSRDDLMGDLFDLDGDGKTSLDEELLVYSLFREAQAEEEKESCEDDDFFSNPAPSVSRSASSRPAMPVRPAPVPFCE